MGMKSMLALKETLCNELDKLGRKEAISTQEIDQIQKLTSAIKNIGKIGSMEAEGMYDEDSPSYRGGRSYGYPMYPAYGDGYSNRRGVSGTGSYHGGRGWELHEIDRDRGSYADGERERRMIERNMREDYR